MLSYKVGYGGAAGAKAMAAYLRAETMAPVIGTRAAYYLGRGTSPDHAREPTQIEVMGTLVHDGTLGFTEAVDILVRERLARSDPDFDIDAFEQQTTSALADAVTRADFLAEGARAHATAELRQDISPQMLWRFGIGSHDQPITTEAVANLLDGKAADGSDIQGKTKRSETLSLAKVFGLQGLPDAHTVEHVLAGHTATGEAPALNGMALSDQVVQGARRRFLAAYGAPSGREPTETELEHMKAGRLARGVEFGHGEWQRLMNATRPRVAYVDLTFSPDKSLSVAWALAPTEAERAAILGIHDAAVDAAMSYVQETIGHVRRGDGGRLGTEKAELFSMKFTHYSSRPTWEVARVDAQGEEYTERHTVPMRIGDPQPHTHVIVLNSALTESGHIGSLNLDELEGRVKEFGHVYQAYVAKFARAQGIEVALDEATGAARFTAVPNQARDMFSARHFEAEDAARKFVADKGLDWDDLNDAQRIAMLKTGAAEMRKAKDKQQEAEGIQSDFDQWRKEAEGKGYHHRSVLRPDEIKPELEPEQRRSFAYERTNALFSDAFDKAATLKLSQAREIIASGLVEAGIDDPGKDIAAVMRLYHRHGLMQDGEMTPVIVAPAGNTRGRAQWEVTTGLTEAREKELTAMTRYAAADRSSDLTPQAIEKAAQAYLQRNPRIDPNGAQWQAQRELIEGLGRGGRLTLGVGVAGAGKTTAMEVLADAWREDGRRIYGATTAWRATSGLKDAGIRKVGGMEATAALEVFLRRAEAGKYQIDNRSVIVVDEVSLVGTRSMLRLARLQERTGAQVALIGDPRQCQSPEAGSAVDLMIRALGEERVPQVLTSIRQKSLREQEITGLWREGKAAEALAMKAADGDLRLVGGSRADVIRATAAAWMDERQRTGEARPVITMDNASAHDVGVAIRALRQEAGDLGPDAAVLNVRDVNARVDRQLPVTPGDVLRLYTRVSDRDNWRHVLGSNGDAVEVLAIDKDGLRIRNVGDGAQGFATWKALTPFMGDRPALAYGSASTVDAMQGRTLGTDPIVALPDGSRRADAPRIYSAMSRHENRVTLIVSEGAERRQLYSRIAAGSGFVTQISRDDVLRNIASNLSRSGAKSTATALLSSVAKVHRGAIRSRAVSHEPGERVRPAGIPLQRQFDRVRLEIGQGFQQVRQAARELVQMRAPSRGVDRGPSRGR